MRIFLTLLLFAALGLSYVAYRLVADDGRAVLPDRSEASPAVSGSGHENRASMGVTNAPSGQENEAGNGAENPAARPARGPLQVGKQRARTGTPPPGAIRFPDGTWMPPANGVETAAPWPGMPQRRPWSPVVEVFRNPADATLWFRHEDGTHSSLQMRDVETHGETAPQPVWLVGSPVPGADAGDAPAPPHELRRDAKPNETGKQQ